MKNVVGFETFFHIVAYYDPVMDWKMINAITTSYEMSLQKLHGIDSYSTAFII